MWTEILSLEACLLLVCGKSFVSVLHLSRSKAGLTGPQPPSLIPGSSSTFLQANLLIFFGLLRTTNGSTCHLVLVRKSESSCGWHVAAYEDFGCPGSRTCPLCCACQCPNASSTAGVLGSWSRWLDPGAPGSEGLASREALAVVTQPGRPAPGHRIPL